MEPQNEVLLTWDYRIWGVLLQIGVLAIMLLVGNTIRRKIKPLRQFLLPTSLIAGFLALGLKYVIYAIWGKGSFIDNNTMEAIAYHCLGIGFVAMTLKETKKPEDKNLKAKGIKSGMLIVSTYALQCALGMAITIFLSKTFFPGLFEASGLLLMLGYGQGPGQAGNIGTAFEALGFEGGNAFGLSIASIGILWASIGGVIYMNILRKRAKMDKGGGEISMSIEEEVQVEPNEIPHSEAIDKLSIQVAFVLMVYTITYLVMFGIGKLCDSGTLGNLGKNSIKPLVWGFNFIWATLLTMLLKVIIKLLRKTKLMNRQYTNNYMLNRIGGLTFDFMVVAAICAIDIELMTEQNLWVPLIILCVVGGFVTLFYVQWTSKRLYKGYQIEGILSMYGMLTGTMSNGMVLLREVDPELKTPAASNLIFGSTWAIIFGAPLLLLIGIAHSHYYLVMGLTFAITTVFFALMMIDFSKFKKGKKGGAQVQDSTEQKE